MWQNCQKTDNCDIELQPLKSFLAEGVRGKIKIMKKNDTLFGFEIKKCKVISSKSFPYNNDIKIIKAFISCAQ